jgi:hypothetical protein
MATQIKFFDAGLKKVYDNLDEDDPLKKAFDRAFLDIERDPRCGDAITKKTFQKRNLKRFAAKYGVSNIRVYDLSQDLRLLYSLGGGKIGIIAVILKWMNHKEYDKLFK